MSQVQIPIDYQQGTDNIEKSEYRFFLTGTVTAKKISELADTFYDVDDVNKQIPNPKPIRLIINSPGGDMFAAQMLSDVIDEIDTPVHATGYGLVGSAAFHIFIGCEHGYRTCAKYTRFLSHRFTRQLTGEHSELQDLQKDSDLIFENMVEHYMICTGMNRKKVETYLLPPRQDVWLSAEQCLKFGVVDKILEGKYVKQKRTHKQSATE